MGTRTELQSVLEGLQDGVNVYFQPPASLSLTYPAIVYNRDFRKTEYADNAPYVGTWRYLVMVIVQDPDSDLIDLVAKLPMTSYVRHFAHDNLNHEVFYVYF
jgi:hypothetical protein